MSIITDSYLIEIIKYYSDYKNSYEKLNNKYNKIKNDLEIKLKKCKICDKYEFDNCLIICTGCHIRFCQKQTCLYFMCGRVGLSSRCGWCQLCVFDD